MTTPLRLLICWVVMMSTLRLVHLRPSPWCERSSFFYSSFSISFATYSNLPGVAEFRCCSPDQDVHDRDTHGRHRKGALHCTCHASTHVIMSSESWFLLLSSMLVFFCMYCAFEHEKSIQHGGCFSVFITIFTIRFRLVLPVPTVQVATPYQNLRYSVRLLGFTLAEQNQLC
jgi:hypothetical protein